MIKLNSIFFNGDIVDDETLSYNSFNTPLHNLILNVMEELQKTDDFIHPEFKLNEEYVNPEIEILPPKEDIEIEVVFIDNNEVFDFFNAPSEGVVGLHLINSGVFEDIDEDYLSKKHRVLVYLNEDMIKNHFLEERLLETDPFSNRYDYEYLSSILTSITHELIHCKEFIEHGNGITPSEAENLNESGDLDLRLKDLSTGNGCLFPYMSEECNVSDNDLVDVMEERVEAAGIKLFKSLNLNKDILNLVLSHYSPSDDLINQKLNPKKTFKHSI